MKSRNYRILGVVQDLLNGQEITVKDIMHKNEVSGGTARRLFAAIRETLPTVESKRGREKTVRLEHNSSDFEPKIVQACAIELGSNVMEIFHGTQYYDAYRQLNEQTKGTLSEANRRRLEKMHNKVVFLRGPHVDPALHKFEFHFIMDALYLCRVLSFVYRKADGSSTRRSIEPWAMIVEREALYVLGAEVDSSTSPKLWRLDRMRECNLENETYNYPSLETFDHERFFENSFGAWLHDNEDDQELELRFTGIHADYISNMKIHPSQIIERTDEGVVVRLQLAITPQFRRWVRGFGAECQCTPSFDDEDTASASATMPHPRQGFVS